MKKFNKKLSKELVQKSMSLMTVFVLLGTLSVACSNTDKPIAVTGVSLTNAVTHVGDAPLTLMPTISPSNATNQAVTWSSDNTSVATVDQNGKVTAVRTGVAKITVTTADGNHTATATITVELSVAGVILNITSVSIDIKETLTLLVAIEPRNATNQDVTWSSDNKSVATVGQNGEVTAKSAGSATITVTTQPTEAKPLRQISR